MKSLTNRTTGRIGSDNTLFLLDDDEAFLNRLAKAMEKRGFDVRTFQSVSGVMAAVEVDPPAYAICDLRLGDGSGLDVVNALQKARQDCRVVVLTGYGALATAVASVKIGAIDYLSKPADADEIKDALLTRNGQRPPAPDQPLHPDAVRLKHIEQVFEDNGGNVSETARKLNMHRRTLQRTLGKQAL